MSNPKDIVCRGVPDVQRYITPCDFIDNSGIGTTQSGGNCNISSSTNCLGHNEIPLGLNPASSNFPPSPSEIAWDHRYCYPPTGNNITGGSDSYTLYKKYKKLYKGLKSGSKGLYTDPSRKLDKKTKSNH